MILEGCASIPTHVLNVIQSEKEKIKDLKILIPILLISGGILPLIP